MHENTSTPEKRGPGRPRKEEVREQRRKRPGERYAYGRRLGVDPSILDHAQFQYRWINDKDARMLLLTKHDDYEIVRNDGGAVKEDSSDLGDAVTAHAGVKENGQPFAVYLCRKPRAWYEEDQAAAQKALDEQFANITRGKTREGDTQSDYVPHSGIHMS